MLLTLAALLSIAPPAPSANLGYYAQPTIHGDRIVFQSGGDLWTAAIPADGTRSVARRLTGAAALEARPVLSPDGTRVAFMGYMDGNPEVYVLPVDGGIPRRLTFHPGRDLPVAWTPDGASVLVRSSRSNPMGNDELWKVPAAGGPLERFPMGECSMATVNPKSGEIAFLRWSNESWYWKGYRGGTAPDVWVASPDMKQFRRATKTDENELFPMWIGDRIFFLSDTDGRMNVWSVAADGTDRKRHTGAGAGDFDLRWASADAGGAPRIAYCQGADLWVLDVPTGAARKLDIVLAGDRLDERPRLVDPLADLAEVAPSPDGKRVALVSRGEVVVGPVGKPEPGVMQSWVQLAGCGGSRESGITWDGDGTIVVRTDAGGDAAIAAHDVATLGIPGDATCRTIAKSDRWIFAPQVSPDGTRVAYGDKSLRMLVAPMAGGDPVVVGTSADGEVTDYRWSPDGAWLAWVETGANGLGRIHLWEAATGKDTCVSDGMTDDRTPRWDPKGQYLYFTSPRAIDPVMDQFDMAFATVDSTEVFAVPLDAAAPPPLPAEAAAAGMDLKEWAAPAAPEAKEPAEAPEAPEPVEAGEAEEPAEPDMAPPAPEAEEAAQAMTITLEGFMARAAKLPVEPGTFAQVEAIHGGLLLLQEPVRGLAGDDARSDGIAGRPGVLLHCDLASGETSPLPDQGVGRFVVNQGCSVAILATESAGATQLKALNLGAIGAPADPINLPGVTIAVDIRAEWAQILDEAWRLLRDFFWKPDMGGVDWKAVRARYEALLPRVGTRLELTDLVGEMSGELGTSHTYIGGGENFEDPKPVMIGLLGIDATIVPEGIRIDRVLPDFQAQGGEASPLSAPHLGVKSGDVILAIDGRGAKGIGEVGELLQGKAGTPVMLAILPKEGEAGQPPKPRVVEVAPILDEEPLRYRDWVEGRRRAVAERSGGKLGYIHIPDMGGAGLSAFVRGFYPQFDKAGLVIDDRFNGGGFVSQMILERLKRRSIARDVGREGLPMRYPTRSPEGPMAVIINENAGSDGDIFPWAFRQWGLGPVIGMRTWGGVVGIRDDKPFQDGGHATQPEYAFWEPKLGYFIENRGVQPDIEVELTPADRAAGRDPQLERAVDEVLARIPKDPAPMPPKPGKGNTPTPPAVR
jgi:tricorn protease